MYKILDEKGVLYSEYQYTNEAEYEKMVVSNAEVIFGAQGLYFDVKKKINIYKAIAPFFHKGAFPVLEPLRTYCPVILTIMWLY